MTDAIAFAVVLILVLFGVALVLAGLAVVVAIIMLVLSPFVKMFQNPK